jgi:hypothetical protein
MGRVFGALHSGIALNYKLTKLLMLRFVLIIN